MSSASLSTASAARRTTTALSSKKVAPMSSLERLQLIRVAVTRIEHALESYRHSSALDPFQQQTAPTFAKIQSYVTNWHPTGHKRSKKQVAAGPTSHREQLQSVSELMSDVKGMISKFPNHSNSDDVAYEKLSLHYLQSIEGNLFELTSLLQPLAEVTDQASRKQDATNYLQDAVAHLVSDADMIAQKHLPAYIEECLNEGVCYTAEVQDESAHVRLDRAPLVGIFVVDAAIGISPVRSPRPALSHLLKLIELVETRCKSEVQVLTALLEQKNDATVAEQLSVLEQILAAAEAARHQNATLRADWAAKEDKYLREAIRGIDQTLLRQSKSLDALKLLDSVTAIARQLQHIALPFLAPQYCRRRGLSYTSPCSLRLGIRLYDPRSAAFLSLTNVNNSTVNNDGVTPIAPDLLPSTDELWLDFDRFPEVVKGERCVLRNATEEDHFRSLEEQREVGGYYVINGGERIIRALMMQRSNVPLNILRDRFAEAGPGFSNKAVVVRSKRPSGVTAVNYFYYSTTGEIVFSFARRIVWHIPVSLLLMACKSTSPKELFEALSSGVTDPDQIARIEAFLQCHANKPYASCTDLVEFLAVIGRMYRAYQQNASMIHFIPDLTQKSQPQCDAWYGLFMIRRHLLTHLNVKAPTPDCPVDGILDPTWPGPLVRAELEAKFHALVHLVRQLYGFVAGASEHQGNDVPSFQEVFGPSQLLIAGLETCIASFCKTAARRLAMNVTGAFFNKFAASPMDASLRLKLRHYVEGACSRSPEALGTLTKLMTTGNFKVDRDEDFFLPQNSGWIVMAEHLNFFRFFEQLRTLHRGKKIAEMRSSEVRKYPSEAFGFLCMVHSPDGEDCGIVNFMSVSTVVTLPTDETAARSNLLQLAEAQFNLVKLSDPLSARVGKIPFLVEGAVLGYLAVSDAERLTADLRSKKLYRLSDAKTALQGPKSGLYHTEVVLVRPGEKSPEGLFVFTSGCRMMRSVTDLQTGMSLMIGTWEQIWLDIAAVPSDLVDAKRDIGKTYQLIETSGTNIVSLTSNTIPFFEHNCSPRNLFQCGLSKQSCGTQLQSAAWRKEAKLFRVVTPQRYLVRTTTMDEAGLDDFSLGVNAVVAVLAYTGYDMDDAVIVNRSAVERGLLTALITVAKVVDLKSQVNCPPGDVAVFHNLDSTGGFVTPELDARGLPPKRTPYGLTKFDRDHTHPSLVDSSAVYSYALRSTSIDPDTRKPKFTYQKHAVKKWRDFDKGENAWVHHVVPLEYDGPDVTKVLIVFRIPRSPYVGDKFSSRHGQKGTLPLHIKSHDLPFTSRGMTPDVIINPHAFPSRMTLGMMLEMVAGKMSAVQGRYFDNSPWTVVDEDPVSAERVGEALVSNGFARYGRETLYCGNTGAMMDADVFFGVCGYQRLRHMVSDKWQSRARTDHTHKAVTKTGQPVKGRKRHGGVRVGEMERDGLLSHGIAAVVQDRLLHVSDKTKAFICSRCGSLVGIYEKHTSRFQTVKECGYCGEEASGHSGNDNVQLIDIPQVLRLWASELTGVGVRVAFKIEDPFRADH